MERYWRQRYHEAQQFYTSMLISQGFIIAGLVMALVAALR